MEVGAWVSDGRSATAPLRVTGFPCRQLRLSDLLAADVRGGLQGVDVTGRLFPCGPFEAFVLLDAKHDSTALTILEEEHGVTGSEAVQEDL